MTSRNPPTKKPSGGRPLRASTESRTTSTRNSGSGIHQGSLQRDKKPSTLRLVKEDDSEPSVLSEWVDGTTVASPQFDDISLHPTKAHVLMSPEPMYGFVETPTSPGGSFLREPASPSKLRWDSVRRHVLKDPSPSVSPSITPPRVSSPKPSLNAPGRPSTPKASRFPRLGMRQVVDTAREAVLDDMRRFTEEIEKACLEARIGDVNRLQKVEREPSQGTVGSYLSLPLAVGGSSTTLPVQGVAKQTSQGLGSARPSVNGLLRTLERYEISPIHRPRALPHENQVLSALLMPFLSHGAVDAEKQLSLRAFTLITQTWTSDSNEGELSRCLWCCNAASNPTKYRTEILGTLSSLIFTRDAALQTDSPMILQTLLQGLFTLYPLVSDSPADLGMIQTLILEILGGGSGVLSEEAVHQEFGCPYSSTDTESLIRTALVTESVARCVSNGSRQARGWILRNLMEEHWPLPHAKISLSPLLMNAYIRKINTFARAALQLLNSSDSAFAKENCDTAIRIIDTRIIPEIALLGDNNDGETKGLVIRLLLQVSCVEAESGTPLEAAMRISQWYREAPPWRSEIHKCLSHLIEVEDTGSVVKTLRNLEVSLTEDVSKAVFTFCFPKLCDRLVAQPSLGPDPSINELLQSIATSFPQLFFKPLFACAASNRDISVVNHLCVLLSLSTHMPGLWTLDAEMISVALMGTAGKEPKKENINMTWDRARLGPTVVLLELIGRLRAFRQTRQALPDHNDSLQDRVVAFATSLESRLAILLEAKESQLLIPFSSRILFCTLFLEIRLLTRSLKSTSWLGRVVSWISQWHENSTGDRQKTGSVDEEVHYTITKLQTIYTTAQAGFQPNHKPRSTMIFASNTGSDSSTSSGSVEPLAVLSERGELISSLSYRLEPSAYSLLVAVSGMLSVRDCLSLSPILWNTSLDTPDTKILSPACFLVMQCAEKCPTEFVAYIQDGMMSHDVTSRRQALRRLAKLLSWRFQILSQKVVLDRSYRRPFKSTRPPISFIATDIGSSSYVREDDLDDKSGKALPLELRKRLQEIGWGDDDKPIDQQLEWAKTPMSILPSSQLSKLGAAENDSLAGENFQAIFEKVSLKSPSQDGSSKRKSLGDMTAKRRPIFVTSLVSVFPHVASLVFDSEFSVANDARNLLLDLMRDDPSILSRSVFNVITGDESELSSAISTLRSFLHVRHVLPPATAHHIFTHLTGYLKFAARQVETPDALQGFAYTIPILAKLMPQVNGMSIREIRRAKIEVFLIPTLSLWFSPSAPIGPMFPRSLGDHSDNPFEASPKLAWITMIRISQNMLFLSMLEKSPQDVHIIRKNLAPLVLPTDNADQGPLGLSDFTPRRETLARFDAGGSVSAGLSLILSRSYLLLVAQIFRCMSRHTNDRSDFMTLVEGINRVLLAHGDDTGIVGQALIGLMAAGTRFRRIFTSAGGYTVFMPAIFKVYAEAGEGSAIRLAIEYATNRFYAIHQEAFVFQTLDIISTVMVGPGASDLAWTSKALYSLLSTLKSATPSNAPDPAGIHHANKGQEREAIIVNKVEEKPQTLFEQLRIARGADMMKLVGSELPDVPEEFEEKRFGLDDIVRIFLTVIAHNPRIVRAERFLHLFRYLAPDLYHASNSARTVLTEGVNALGWIFLARAVGKTKAAEAQMKPGGDMKFEAFGSDDVAPEDKILAQSNSPVDLLKMRMEYLFLVNSFTGAGGQLGASASLRIIELAKVIMKDSRQHSDHISLFLGKYMKGSLLRDQPLSTKFVVEFLNELAPIVSVYHSELDLSEVLDTVSQLAQNPSHANDVAFARVVVTQYCAAGLEACELAASAGFIFSLPLRASVVRLMNSCVTLRGVDVVAQLELRTNSYEFLAGVVLPFALALQPTSQAVTEIDPTHGIPPNTHAKTWARLLAYIMSASKKTVSPQEMNRSASPLPGERKNTDRRRSAKEPVPIPTLAICLQILKVIVVKAEEDLSSVLPDAWFRIGAFLTESLSEGSAAFALYPLDMFQPPSPIHSPRVSISGEPGGPLSFPPSRRASGVVQPRVVDYLLWSLFELLCLHRTSLLLHMRVMMQEKVRMLEDQLQLDRTSVSINYSSVRYSRRVSAAFSKRGRTSRYNSSASIDPLNLRPTTFSPSDFSSVHSTPTKVGREAGYLWSSPGQGTPTTGPQIVHLGPVQHSALFRGPSLEAEGAGNMRLASTTAIKSITLIRETFRRIRLVQTCLGYNLLLPYPEGDTRYFGEEGAVDVSGWTKTKSLQAIMDETKQLIEEFSRRRDGHLEFDDVGDNTVVVDADQSLYFATN